MRAATFSRIIYSPFHFVWVIIFFLVNGYNNQSQEIRFSDLLLLFFILSGTFLLLFIGVARILHSSLKAGLLTSIVATGILFFGVFQDWIGSVRAISFLGALKVFSVIVIFFFILIYIWLKTSKATFRKATVFTHTLFLVYLSVELVSLAQRKHPVTMIQESNATAYCNGCPKPDVYLIVLDEYFGSSGLRNYFGYDNAEFEHFLKGQQFTVLSNSRSNYHLTLFSMASMLNMEYLQSMGEINMKNAYAYRKAFSQVEFNAVVAQFRKLGYAIDNLSIFNMAGAPSNYATGLLPSKIQLINSKTLYYRLAKSLPEFLAKRWQISWFAKKIDDDAIAKNHRIMDESLKRAAAEDSIPVFTYIHLQMPHKPFAFDSTGRKVIPFWSRKSYSPAEWDDAYLQYLVYTNKKISNYLLQLLSLTKKKSAIILMSDHGYRDSDPRRYNDIFQSLNAVYIPGKTAGGWYNGMTNVNQFRVLFNTLFNAKLPLLKDSLVR